LDAKSSKERYFYSTVKAGSDAKKPRSPEGQGLVETKYVGTAAIGCPAERSSAVLTHSRYCRTPSGQSMAAVATCSYP
jgi:hypothetical protein